MKPYHRHPFMKAEPNPAGGTDVSAGNPDSVPQSTSGDAPAAHPMDARPANPLSEEETDLGQSLRAGTEEKSGGKDDSAGEQTTFFQEGFDPATLEAPLQGKYKEMEAAFTERMSQIPDAETLGLIGTKSQAFDRLVQMPEFQQWAERMTGEEGQATVGQEAAAEAAGSSLLEGLDEDVQSGIVKLIEQRVNQEIAARVTPISDAYFSDKAEQTITSLKTTHGEETIARLAPMMHTLMESKEGLDVNDAFKLARFDELQAQLAQQKQTTTTEKFHANMEGDGATGTTVADTKVKSAGDAVNLALDMIRQGDPRAFDPTRLPPGYRGE